MSIYYIYINIIKKLYFLYDKISHDKISMTITFIYNTMYVYKVEEMKKILLIIFVIQYFYYMYLNYPDYSSIEVSGVHNGTLMMTSDHNRTSGFFPSLSFLYSHCRLHLYNFIQSHTPYTDRRPCNYHHLQSLYIYRRRVV